MFAFLAGMRGKYKTGETTNEQTKDNCKGNRANGKAHTTVQGQYGCKPSDREGALRPQSGRD